MLIKNTRKLKVADFIKITRYNTTEFFYYKVLDIINLHAFTIRAMSHEYEGDISFDCITEFNTYIMTQEEVTEYLLSI